MQRGWYGRLVGLLLLCAGAVYSLYPSYKFYFRSSEQERSSNQTFCQGLPKWVPCAKLNLGLDLQGGVHLVMGVRIDKALEHRLDRLADAMREGFKNKGIKLATLEHPTDTAEIVLALAPDTAWDVVEKYLRKEWSMLEVQQRHNTRASLVLTKQESDMVRDTAVEQSIKTIRNRADKLGVTEPTIARRGSDGILIQLPGVKDPQHAIDIIGRTAQLEFKIADAAASAAFKDISQKELPEGVVKKQTGTSDDPDATDRSEIYFELPESQKENLFQLLQSKLAAAKLAADRMVAVGPVLLPDGTERPDRLRTYVLHTRPGITGDYLVNAQVQQDRDIPTDYYVMMNFDAEGAKIFARLTTEHVGEPMAIVLDDKINSVPVIQNKITDGRAQITLGRGGDAHATFQKAKDLALVLKAGALPAPVEIREKRQVGKTLGQDTVAKGTFAMALGAALVVVFMALYYKASGMIANMALFLNVLFMLAFMALIDATLTLPGMAGIVLTIGMAVDANVLIFERIREELRQGKSPRLAIDAGYKKAFGTIFDSNITTLIAGVVLMQYGTGPVRGFAVTLMIGLTCSMYTAIVVTRLVYDFMTSRRSIEALSI